VAAGWLRHALPAQLSAHLGIVFQDPESQLFTMVVEDEVAFCREPACLVTRWRVTWALRQVAQRAPTAPANSTGGQAARRHRRRHRRAAGGPLDEPTASPTRW
jgi:ABC-type sulfate/molybdate transport systems ATPase subunit